MNFENNEVCKVEHYHWWEEESRSNPFLTKTNGRLEYHVLINLRCKKCKDIAQREIIIKENN